MRVRHRPTETEAERITGDPAQVRQVGGLHLRYDRDVLQLWVANHNTWEDVQEGDYAVRELDGSGWYPCRRAFFDATYEVIAAAPE
jgi:hypothetical protein